jgi:uncharacterized repeat protein (TIGR03847 family)
VSGASSFDLDAPQHFTAGAVGEPGHRVFYVQASQGSLVVTLKLEKTQVAALAQYVAELLADLPPVPEEDVPLDVGLLEPTVPEWTVGTIGVAVDEARDRLVVTFQELQPQGEDELEEEDDDEDDEDVNLATFTITRPQAMTFVRKGAELVAAGRPPCTLCGRPLDPEGHVCIKTNGHLH